MRKTITLHALGLVFSLMAMVSQVLAQSATLLPNAKQQYLDDSANPVANGQVYYYVPSTSTLKNVWLDEDKNVLSNNPVQLDAAGRPQPTGQTFGDGLYRQKVVDQNGLTVWDAVTSSTGGGSGGTSPAWSEGVMVGTMIPWTGTVLPSKYLYAAGQAVLRASFPELFAAITFQTNILCNLGTATITVPTDISDKTPIGAPLEASCFPPGVTVIAKSSGLLTMSANATVTVSVSARILPWGNGDGATTFNVPEQRGRVAMGRNNMNSSTSSTMTSDYYGTNPNGLGAYGGNQLTQIMSGHLPPYEPTGLITSNLGNQPSPFFSSALGGTPFVGNPGTSVSTLPLILSFGGNPYGGGIAVSATVYSGGSGYTNGAQVVTLAGGTCEVQPQFTVTVTAGAITNPVVTTPGKCVSPPTNVASFTGAGAGTGGRLNVTYSTIPISRVMPASAVDYIVKALPDDLPAGPGVTSIQGMTGAIACAGNAINCSGQTITVNLPTNIGVTSLGGMTGAIACGTGVTCAAGTISSQRLNYADYGIKCDGTTDDGPAFNTALNALAGAPLLLPSGTCRIATKVFYNTTNSTAGVLAVPGATIVGQGRDVTKIETDVANDYSIALNSAWASVHKSMFVLTPGTSGSLASNTYWVEVTATVGGQEIDVTVAKSAVVTGPNGSIAMTLAPIDTGYCYNVYIGTTSATGNYATVSGNNAVCIPAGNITITATGSAHAVPTFPQAIWQTANFSNFSFVNNTVTANASALLWFRVAYSTISNLYFNGMSANGMDMPNWTGDLDGSFIVTIDNTKFNNIPGWCLMAAGNTLEFSNFTVSNSVFNLCGTLPTDYQVAKTISAITNANPGVVTTSTNHNLLAGDQVLIQSVAGMSLPTMHYRACGTLTATTFSLCDLNGDNVNTTSLGSYTASSGNERLVFRPPQMQANGNGPTMSGAIAYTGLISNWLNNGYTQNKNTNLYFSEAGANDQALMSNTDFENTDGVGMYIANVVGLNWLTGECLSAVSIANNATCIQLGTGLAKGGAQNVQINNLKFRNDSGSALGFVQLKGAGGLSYPNTVTVKNVYWQTFSGLFKYVNFQGNPAPFFWARFDGKTGSTCTLKDSFNVASCTRNGTGDYTVTYTNPSLDANYAVSGVGTNTGTSVGALYFNNLANITTTSVRFLCINFSVVTQDCDMVSIQGFGNPQ